jgi:putative lipoprotein
MRSIRGTIVLPADVMPRQAHQVAVEVRDVSVADAPSMVIAAYHLSDVIIKPGGRIPFEIEVPEVEATRALSLRVHVSLQEGQNVKAGDLISTVSCPVPTSGALPPVTIPVKTA